MDLTALLLQLQAALSAVSPVAAGLIGLVLILLKNGTIKLPKLPLLNPSKPADVSDPSHKSLRERLKDRIDARFTELADDEGEDADDVYAELIRAVKAADTRPESDE